jgi:hypothetical protein
MSDPKTYTGGCHCGAVRYEVKMDLSGPVIACNCSMCGRTGTLLGFVSVSQFTLHKGEQNLTDYTFNKNVIHHLFCKTCGIKSFARGTKPDGTQMVAINTRCLDGVDAAQLKVQQVEGKNF